MAQTNGNVRQQTSAAAAASGTQAVHAGKPEDGGSLSSSIGGRSAIVFKMCNGGWARAVSVDPSVENGTGSKGDGSSGGQLNGAQREGVKRSRHQPNMHNHPISVPGGEKGTKALHECWNKRPTSQQVQPPQTVKDAPVGRSVTGPVGLTP